MDKLLFIIILINTHMIFTFYKDLYSEEEEKQKVLLKVIFNIDFNTCLRVILSPDHLFRSHKAEHQNKK